MNFLTRERETLDRFLPGFDEVLRAIPLMKLEVAKNPGLQLFREAGGAGLLVPTNCGGSGATPLDALHIQRAIASRSPSLAIATTMHHFSIATIVEVSLTSSGLESLLLEAIAQQNRLVASGFAEGRPGHGILAPTMRAVRRQGEYVVTGSKKPCSLTWSMDLLTATVSLELAEGKSEVGVVLIPADAEGLERCHFWKSPILAGAESDEIVLKDVIVPERLFFPIANDNRLDDSQISGFLWFELLITASYLGVASALAERVLERRRGSVAEQAQLGTELEGAMMALEGVARSMIHNRRDHNELARLLFTRYAVQQAIARASAQAVEMLGGMAYISSDEISYLFATTRALVFHPPSFSSVTESLSNYLYGGEIHIA